MRKNWISIVLLLAATAGTNAFAGAEVFGKGSISKSYISRDSWTVSVSMAGGLAFTLIPRVRIEGRYTNISALQNRLDVGSPTVVGTLNDIKTETAIYSLGLDIDILGEKSSFQPFLFVGGGYVVTQRSYYYTPVNSGATYVAEPDEKGFSANLGAGFRLRVMRSLAFEIEVFAYGLDIDQPNPLINLYGTVGVRLYI